MKNCFYRVIVIAFALAVSSAALAYTFDGKDVKVEYWSGTGSNEAICVIDFGPQSFAFGHRWDGVATGMDMIRAIDDAGSLDLVLQNFGWGLFVDGIIYNGYSRIGYDGGENWWHYWVSSDGDNWTSPWDYGASGRILSNGDWDGWGYGFASAPDIPLVPEPSSLLAILSLVGAGVSIKKKR